MLAPDRRLRRSSDINKVYAKGRYGAAKDLHVRVLNTGLKQTRAAVVVGKKVSKKAVVRNRNRRRLTELLGAEWKELVAGQDLVITVHSDLSVTPAAQLKEQLTSALNRAGATEKRKP